MNINLPDCAVILVGGHGTRLSEETTKVPKPLVEVGPFPILLHIMKIYAHYGVKKFILCAGYKQHIIKRYFNDLHLSHSDLTFNIREGTVDVIKSAALDWEVTVVDTGLDTLTGKRLREVESFLPDQFFMTYGDGVADIDLNKLFDVHKKGGRLATVTAVQPSGRFGALDIANGSVNGFMEKPKGDGNWINGGFFVFEKSAIKHMLQGDVMLEDGLLNELAKSDQLTAYAHDGFWQPMDTIRDKEYLNKLWDGDCPWRLWDV